MLLALYVDYNTGITGNCHNWPGSLYGTNKTSLSGIEKDRSKIENKALMVSKISLSPLRIVHVFLACHRMYFTNDLHLQIS
jgi:hypothetical protein